LRFVVFAAGFLAARFFVAAFFLGERVAAFFFVAAFFLGERFAAFFFVAAFFLGERLAAFFFAVFFLVAAFFLGERFAVLRAVVFFAAFFLVAFLRVAILWLLVSGIRNFNSFPGDTKQGKLKAQRERLCEKLTSVSSSESVQFCERLLKTPCGKNVCRSNFSKRFSVV